MKKFDGLTICCIASGPSLTEEDCKLIEESGLPTIAINNAWKLARFCEVLYAADFKYWNAYLESIDIDAEFWTCSKRARDIFGINHHDKNGAVCSGARAIEFAIEQGAKKIILIGYDNSLKNGIHFDGKHTGSSYGYKLGNPNQVDLDRFKNAFARINKKEVDIVNCSRYTELKTFRIGKLEEELCLSEA